MYLGRLNMIYVIHYEFYKEIIKFNELNSLYCDQRLLWREKLQLPILLMMYEKWGQYWVKNSENWATHVQLMPFSTNMYLSWPQSYITHFQVCQICYKGNPIYLMSSWTKLHLNGIEIMLLIHSKRNQRPIFFIWPSRPPLFQFNIFLLWSPLLKFTL